MAVGPARPFRSVRSIRSVRSEYRAARRAACRPGPRNAPAAAALLLALLGPAAPGWAATPPPRDDARPARLAPDRAPGLPGPSAGPGAVPGTGRLPGAAFPVRPADPDTDPGALAGDRAGEGRPHPGRPEDQGDLMGPLPSERPGGPAWRQPDSAQDDSAQTDSQTGALPDQDGTGGPDGGEAGLLPPGHDAGGRGGGDSSAVPRPAATPHPPTGHPRRPGDVGRPPQAAPDPGERLRVLPLGTGMALIGLGLAFLGLRLRRR